MVDGKVCNAETHTKSTMRCYICYATSSEFNDLSKKRACEKEKLSFGFSLLHDRIRFFESLSHVATGKNETCAFLMRKHKLLKIK